MVQPPLLEQLRGGADPIVWAAVSYAMRDVEARDSIVFRAGDVGRGWRVAATTMGLCALASARVRGRRAAGTRPVSRSAQADGDALPPEHHGS